jgi:hypothetical protein
MSQGSYPLKRYVMGGSSQPKEKSAGMIPFFYLVATLIEIMVTYSRSIE